MNNVWAELQSIDPKNLAKYLKNEYPQTVAVILTKFSPEFTAKVLEELPESFAMEVMMRISRMEVVSDRVMAILTRVISDDIKNEILRPKMDTVDFLGKVYNGFGKKSGKRFYQALKERNRYLALEIKNNMGGNNV